MEFFFGLFTGYLLNTSALILLILCGVIFEANHHHKTAVFLGVITATVCYFLFKIPLEHMAYGAVGYIAIGVGWSVWRYKRHVDKVVERSVGESSDYRRLALESLSLKRMLGTITSWILVWPFSAVENLIGDFVVMIQGIVTKWLRGIYEGIYAGAANRLLDENAK